MQNNIRIGLNKKTAFTLAEVLITLGIIGVVAAMTLPALISINKERAWAQQQNVFEQKFRQALIQMNVTDVLTDYATTEDFVKELSKYIKIAQKCDSNSITGCYAAQLIAGADDEVTVSDIKTSIQLGHNDYNTNTMSFVVLDGVSVILAYNPKCAPFEPTDNSRDPMACISMIYDVNGKANPNKVGKDIVALNAKLTNCDVRVGKSKLCLTGGDVPFAPISQTPYTMNNNYWAGGIEACKALNMHMPTRTEMAEIASEQYGVTLGIDMVETSVTIKKDLKMKGDYWISEESSWKDAYMRGFWPTYTFANNYTRNTSWLRLRCVK